MAVSSALITIRQTLAAKKSVFVPAVQSALWALSAKPGPPVHKGPLVKSDPQVLRDPLVTPDPRAHRGISNRWHGSRGDYRNQFSFDRSKSCRQCGGAHHHTGCRWSSASLRTSCHCANSVRLPLGQTCRKLFCPQQPITAQGYRSIAYSAVKQVTPKIFIQNMKNA